MASQCKTWIFALFFCLLPLRFTTVAPSHYVTSIIFCQTNSLHDICHYTHEPCLRSSSFPPLWQPDIQHNLAKVSAILLLHMSKPSQPVLSNLVNLSYPFDVLILIPDHSASSSSASCLVVSAIAVVAGLVYGLTAGEGQWGGFRGIAREGWETLLSVVAKPCLSYLYNSRDDVWDYYAVEEMELAEEESDHSWRAVM